MALADLVETIEQDAATELLALLVDAETRANKLEADAAAERAERAASASRASAAEYQAAADAELAAAQRAARTTLLLARAAMLERVLAEARALLPASVHRVAVAFATTAISCAGTQPGVARCTPDIESDVRALAPATLRVEPDERVRAGVVIDLASGTQIVATLDALLEREWPKLGATLLARLTKETVS